MAKGNTTLAISPLVRDKLNKFIAEYNSTKKSEDKELTAKDFISLAVDYFMENKILNSIINDIEIWKDIEESDNKYQISSNGRVKRKSYTQKFNAVRYINGENGLVCNKRLVERIYNERIINPFIFKGQSSIRFSNGDIYSISYLIDKYYGTNVR